MPTMSQARGASKLSATAAAISVVAMIPTIAQNSVVSGAHFVSNRRPVRRTPARSARSPIVPSVRSRVATLDDPLRWLTDHSARRFPAQNPSASVFRVVLSRVDRDRRGDGALPRGLHLFGRGGSHAPLEPAGAVRGPLP